MSRQTSSLGPEILLDLDRASSQPLGAQLQDMFREAIRAGRRRQALVEWAREVDGFIVEDDYDAEFRYDRQPVGSLQGLAPDRVISIGTVSKSLAPGLRLGWMICPPGIVGDVVAEKEWADRGSAGLDQLALASLIRSGRYDRHLRRMGPKYARRRAALVGAMAKHVPTAEVCGLDAGLHAVVKLDPALDEREIITAARERSVGLYGLSDWRHNGATSPPQLVLGFGTSRRVQSNRASPRSQTC